VSAIAPAPVDELVVVEMAEDPDRPCCWMKGGRPVCNKPSAWAFMCPPCGTSDLICHEHRARLLHLMSDGVRFTCATCDRPAVPSDVVPL
jgi:hypothetical protein